MEGFCSTAARKWTVKYVQVTFLRLIDHGHTKWISLTIRYGLLQKFAAQVRVVSTMYKRACHGLTCNYVKAFLKPTYILSASLGAEAVRWICK